MDADALKRKAELLASSAAKLSRVAGAIPSDRDFHFFSNFPEFKSPSRDLAQQSESLLRTLGSSTNIWGRSSTPPPPLPADLDDAYDWLVGLNDDLLERFAASMDEFKSTREKEEAGAKLAAAEMEESGFQLVGKKKRRDGGKNKNLEKEEGFVDGRGLAGVKVATRDKKTSAARSRVPFHIPTIPRPQDQYNILVNNSNQPFEHVWLEQSEDGSRFVHPLEKLSILDFVDRNVGEGEPVQPLPLECTPFKFVEGVKELKELAAKLLDANEFAVDLEHNQYRSFQGLTCLMQISTRTEDFVIDTLKLRIHIGPYLREVFKDPSKRKVMHGADHDRAWLQRDFGIYVCNLFDTCQASRILQLERNSLEYLLRHFCGVNANKEYQNADWRLRPLPNEMLKYAREDTHYLLHIYDLMRIRLLSASSDENDLLLEVYKRSYEICVQLYQKELLTDTSYLYIYGLQDADFDAKQLAVVAGLCEWRDNVARAEDESTGYILPNKALLEIARQMPLSSSKLRQLLKFKHPFVERSLNSVISIIRSSVENSSGFESIAEQLRKARSEKLLVQNTEAVGCNSESTPANEDPMVSSIAQGNVLDDRGNASTMHGEEVATVMDVDHAESSIIEQTSDQVASIITNLQEKKLQSFSESEIQSSVILSGISETTNREKTEVGFAESPMSAKRACVASVQILKKPTGAFGALLGSTSRRKFNPDKRGIAEQDKNECKVEQIKSSVSLPFHSFAGGQKHTDQGPEESIKHLQRETLEEDLDQPSEARKLEDVIPLDIDLDKSQSPAETPRADDGGKHRQWFPPLPENVCISASQSESDAAEVPVSLSELSSSFEECFRSLNERKGSRQNQRASQDADYNLELKPFDYAAARREMKFEGAREEGKADDDGIMNSSDFGDLRKSFALSGPNSGDKVREFQMPRRRQAFPASGNRSMTYR